MLVTLLLAAAVAASQAPGDDPRAIVLAARHAVEVDSVAALRARWDGRLRSRPTDRLAALGLATLARYTYDYEDARRRYLALDAGDGPPADRVAVAARIGLAEAADTRGLMEEALGHYRRARAGARALGDRRAEAEALLGLSFPVAANESLEAGLALQDTALALLPPGEPELRADFHRRRAVLYAVLSRPEAAAEGARCLALARQAGAGRMEAHCWRAIALDVRLRGMEDSSFTLLGRAEALHRRTRDRSMLTETLQRRADNLRAQGHLAAARSRLDEALAEAVASRNLLAEASAQVGLGSIAIQLRDWGSAGQRLRRAVGMFERQGDPSGAMMARSFLLTVLSADGRLDDAEREARAVLDWYRTTGELPNQFGVWRSLVSIALRRRDWAGAARRLDSARAVARAAREPSWLAQADYDEGRLALARGDLAAAERRFGAQLAALDTGQHMARHEVRTRLAEVYARRGELERARDELHSAGADLDRWRAALPSRELRLLAFQASMLEDDDVNAGVPRVVALLVRGGRADDAFRLAEQRRARVLADRLLRAEALRLDETAAAPRAAPGAVEPSALRAALPDDRTALIEYVAGEPGGETSVFVITRHGLRAATLPTPDGLADRIGRMAATLEAGGEPGPEAAALGAAVLEPAVRLLPAGVSRLVLVPDGELHRLPFDALRLADGRFVVERFDVAVAPSASVFHALRGRRRTVRAEEVRLLALGDPAFAGESARVDGTVALRGAFDSAGGLARLPESGHEARLVARYAAAADVRLRHEATAAFLRHEPLDGYRVIHLATHALVDDRSLDRTALALAAQGDDAGFLTPGDLAALRLDADLVVLSACRTAGGVVVGGEGIQGLTGPLLEAGARAVVATGWRIGDRATVRMVEDFYGGLARGLDVSAALRSAKLAALERGAPPGEWAAFTTVGDPFVTLPLRTPPSPWLPSALAAGVGLLVVVGLGLMRRRRAPA